jgi:flagellar biosynthetic protein FlhB
MADQAQNRTLPATERKIRKARTEGQVARSRDLGHLAALGGGAALLLAFTPRVIAWMGERLQSSLRFDAGALASPSSMVDALLQSGTSLVLAVLPLGAALALLAVAGGVASGGWNFTWKALQPRLQKLDPIAGIGRLFSLESMTQTLKACLLALVLGAIGAVYVQQRLPAIAQLMAMPLPAALSAAGNVLWGGVALLLLALAVFALVDVPLQREMLLRRLRMSHEELKKEQKDVEGNVEVKSKIRARMREMANRRMIAAVPGADLVVMNPSHYAVALKYDDKTMAAPRVVAKGKDLIAFKIRDAAEVLAWVYQLRAALAAGRPMTAELPELNVPPELDPANAAADSRQEPDQ